MPRKNYIQIKASDQEKASWIAQAYLEGKNLSNFIRDRINRKEDEMKTSTVYEQRDKKGLQFLCNCPADKVEEKFGKDVWTGRPILVSTGEVDTLLEQKNVVAVYRLGEMSSEPTSPVKAINQHNKLLDQIKEKMK